MHYVLETNWKKL